MIKKPIDAEQAVRAMREWHLQQIRTINRMLMTLRPDQAEDSVEAVGRIAWEKILLRVFGSHGRLSFDQLLKVPGVRRDLGEGGTVGSPQMPRLIKALENLVEEGHVIEEQGGYYRKARSEISSE